MPRNGSGSYSLPELPFVAQTTISSAAVNSDFSDIATALTGSVSSDGQTPITGPIKFASGDTTDPSIAFVAETNTGIRLGGSGVIVFVGSGSDTGSIGPSGFALGNGSVVNPIGSILDYAGSTAPAGWLLCYGQAISRTTYASLYAVIGTTFGSGDGSTTFNVPDLRGRIGVGKDNMGGTAAGRITVAACGVDGTILGYTGGEQTHTLITAELAAHSHGTTTNDPGHFHNLAMQVNSTASLGTGSNSVFVPGGSTATAGALTGITVTVANAGSGNGHNNVQPTSILNKIIFAGV